MKTISPYRYNQTLLTFALIGFLTSWVTIFHFDNGNFLVINWMLNLICLHYLFTTVHQSSHYLLSKNKKFNYAFGYLATLFAGITFADFKFTHDLHHKHIGEPDNDPDHTISGSGPVLLIPFKIFYHDFYFLKYNKSMFEYFSYFSERILQVMLVIVFFLNNNSLFITYWLVPMFIIGIANALFLFYFPHYTHWIEKTWMNKGPLRESIRMSRVYHHKHHDNPSKNSNFFPFEDTMMATLGYKEAEYYDPMKDYFYKK
jgi:beta-carotene hydroxylase